MEVFTAAKTGRFWNTRKLDGKTYHSSNLESAFVQGFIKPKLKRNPLIDGWRSPSSYSPKYFMRRILPSGTASGTGGNILLHVSGTRPDVVSFNNGKDAKDGIITDAAGGDMVKNITVPVPSINVNELRMKILNNVKDEVLDVSMVVAEMQSTVNTISGNLNRIGRSLAVVKKRKPRHFYYLLTGKMRHNRRPTDKFLREASGVFLEWKYGIMPTVYDLQGALKGLDLNSSNELFDHPPLLVARANRTVSEPFTMDVPQLFSWRPVVVKGVVKTTYKARLDYRIDMEGVRALNRYGIGLGSVATVLWDKTPFTFVLDMVVPIADIIKAWSALSGTNVVGYCETLYEEISISPSSGSTDVGNYPGTYVVTPSKASSFSRSAFPSPPMPVPYVRNPIKTGNLATVLALFTQLRS